jgi:hypothetical protein
LPGEIGIAVEVDARVFQMRLVAVAVRDRLIELRLVGGGIDLCEQIAFFDRLPLDETDLDDLAGDLAAHDHVVIGNDRADAAQIDRHVVARDRSSDDAHRRRRRGCRRRLVPPRGARQSERATGDDRDHRDHRQQFGHARPAPHRYSPAVHGAAGVLAVPPRLCAGERSEPPRICAGSGTMPVMSVSSRAVGPAAAAVIVVLALPGRPLERQSIQSEAIALEQ